MELLGGLIVIIPIALFLIDVAIILTCNVTNIDICKRAARAAASVLNNQGQPDAQTAMKTANEVVSNFTTSATITGVTMSYFQWTDNNGNSTNGGSGSLPPNAATPQAGEVMVCTTMTVKPPVPFPFLPQQLSMVSQSIQPIVGLPPILPGAAPGGS